MHRNRMLVFTDSDQVFSKIKTVVRNVVIEVKRAGQDYSLNEVTIALVDPDWASSVKLKKLYNELASFGIYTVLVLNEKKLKDHVPDELSNGLVDDLLLTPIRPVELIGKLKHAVYLSRLGEVVKANSHLRDLIEKIEEDVKITRAIQNTLIPRKFKPVQGLDVVHKYLCGMKSGGDYLDFFEFEDKTHVGILMSDSTGYGLSSAFMSVILRLAVKLSKQEVRSPSKIVSKIFEELQLTMKPKEDFSIFYGILNRKTFELSYMGTGSIRFFHQQSDTNKLVEPKLGKDVLTKEKSIDLVDHQLDLLPGDRMVLMSDGYSETFKSANDLKKTISGNSSEQALSLINDLTFKIKEKFEDQDDLPDQDCSVMVVDVKKRAMRLAK